MNPTIEIESDMSWPNKAIVCSPDCDLCYIADWNEDGSPKRIDCAKEWMVDGVPGSECPVYGTEAKTMTLRLIDEAKIEELWKNFLLHLPDDRDRTIEFTVNTVRELFTAAGLGKEPKTMDEVVVCLTKQEIRDLLDGYTGNAKLRKAWEAMK